MPMIVSKFIICPIAQNPYAAHIVATGGADAFIRFVRQKFADIVYVAIMNAQIERAAATSAGRLAQVLSRSSASRCSRKRSVRYWTR